VVTLSELLTKQQELTYTHCHKLKSYVFGQTFATLDLSHELELKEESQELVTINTHRGLYKYTHLPFGVRYLSLNHGIVTTGTTHGVHL